MEASNKVSVGPIIGTVTDNTARILVEFEKPGKVTCYLLSYSEEPRSRTLDSKPGVPIVFAFVGLTPKTEYSVNLSCPLPERVQGSSFWTIRKNNDDPGRLNAGVVSCNEISIQEKKPRGKDLWADLGKRVQNHELDYIFHIGDQVYMDMEGDYKTKHLYQECERILKSVHQRDWEDCRPYLLELLRGQYRRTWTNPSVARVLANVPNLMICDDHEFRDDWGFEKDDYTKGTIAYFYGELARQVYYEYQRQLRQDIPWENLKSLKCEYYHQILNGVGVSFIEYRGCRSWFREENLEETHIGEAQKKWLTKLFEDKDKFEGVNSVIFISPLPLFLFHHYISKVAYFKSDDIQEHWTYRHIPQLIELLDLLVAWKLRYDGREILVVGGDFHLGGWTDVLYQGEKVFTQFITSAINGHGANLLQEVFLKVLMLFGEADRNYSFEHYEWIRQNNYGIIQAQTMVSTTNRKFSTIESILVSYKN